MKIISLIFLLFTLFIVGCSSLELPQGDRLRGKNINNIEQVSLKKVVLDRNFKGKMGQTIYVPIYSHIYYENSDKSLDLAATLSIRNTDLTNPMIVTSVRYYDSTGNLLKEYLDQPVELNRLASIDFVVNRTDRNGGVGANFIVEWLSVTTVSEPIVEAVMISAVGNQSISFISRGKLIKNYP
ncbi:DUF3124 domain-containing protein [Kamptonema sp. UHCC 0994]|uniref:DUF3124 domain-containing protein n=1 Tax=Kamptonema sp. UHCC 0994 TaxID=3031329 RepID=UPI0023B89BD6|nr:DUF3124 domain-containing protein [Kamptonema sp. UHCC 0994]MDF0552626.1 DUF3124 domain-containing protein [Kamptonema sp. UHCC 0994]